MNSNNNNTNNRKMNASASVSYKTFCKVCQDSGKTEKEYTSHNVRDARGTCCPTLLAQECRICYRKGHTSKYCSQTKPVATAVTKAVTKQVTHVKQQAPKNVFMCLESDSDSEDEKEPEVIKKTEPAPVLKAELKVAQKQALNYGKIIALAPTIVKTEAVAAALKAEKIASEKKQMKIVVSNQIPMKAAFRWADCDTDSGGSEDEEETSAW
jgi:hypothetical protein